MTNNTKSEENNVKYEKAANLRTEYTALSSYFNQVVTFRITILGIYLAAVGIIVSKEQSNLIINLFLAFLTIVVWCLDLRNRTLYTNLSDRGIQIEEEWGGAKKELHKFNAFYHYMMRAKLAEEVGLSKNDYIDYPKIFCKRLPFPISYSITFDLMFAIVLFYSLLRIFIDPNVLLFLRHLYEQLIHL